MKYKHTTLIFSAILFICKNITTTPVYSLRSFAPHALSYYCFALLMFFAPLRSVTPVISMRRCRDEILSHRQHSPPPPLSLSLLVSLLPALLNACVSVFNSMRIVHKVVHVIYGSVHYRNFT